MRRFLLPSALLAVLASGLAVAAWVVPYTYRYEMATCPGNANPGMCTAAQTCSAGSCTGTAPTTQYEGMGLYGVTSYRLTACAASGQTLSGAGTLQAYGFNSAENVWVRNPGLDQSVTASGKQCQAFPDFLVGIQYGRVRFVSSGVTVSGGSTLDVLLDGYAVQN